MPTIDGASLNGLLSSPLVPIAGVLTALIVMLLVMKFRRAGADGPRRLLFPIVLVVLAGLAVMSLLDRMAQDERGAERRALAQRSAELTAQALAPGSALACLEGAAGEAVENACEKTVFAGPQSTAAAELGSPAPVSPLWVRRQPPAEGRAAVWVAPLKPGSWELEA